MSERRSLRRNNLAARSGLGAQSHSPAKRRDARNKRPVVGIGHAIKKRAFGALNALLDGPSAADASHTEDPQPGSSNNDVEMEMEDGWVDEPPPPPDEPPPPAPTLPVHVVVAHPDNKCASTVRAWGALLPRLEQPFLQYRRDTHGRVPPIIPTEVTNACRAACVAPYTLLVQCLYPTPPILLLQHGLFATSPPGLAPPYPSTCWTYTVDSSSDRATPSQRSRRPSTNLGMRAVDPFRSALSNAVLWSSNPQTRIDARVSAALAEAASALGFQSTVSTAPPSEPSSPPGAARQQNDIASPPASNASAHGTADAAAANFGTADAATNDVADTDGASPPASNASAPPPASNASGHGTADAAAATFGNADAAATNDVADTDGASPPASNASAPPPASNASAPPAHSQTDDASNDSAPPAASASDRPPPPREQRTPLLTPGRADRILRERCPACFGLQTWGRPLQEGGDVQLGSDGCFSYRHLKSAGDGPILYTPDYFIPKEKMNEVKARIDAARSKPPAKVKPAMPQEALDACESSWEAANEKKKKADPQRYDASGIFALTCRHSQVLFLCNIDTPGEQQQFIIACLEVIKDYLPPRATILQTYDVGCLTDHSCNLFALLSPGLRERLIYNPRMRRGCGLTDGEGVERLWSRIRKLIPITRNQWNSKRIWMIDLYMSFINAEGRTNLGAWLERQGEKNIAPKLANAKKMLRDCRVPPSELRSEWAAQSSLRARPGCKLRLSTRYKQITELQYKVENGG
ncbi:hypothetical protein B0H13DRAFT_2534733 [Mycena leptocephala]|nr:hypothetical protein B0H13DRAFT_2534733 [Mycena leptocephala]